MEKVKVKLMECLLEGCRMRKLGAYIHLGASNPERVERVSKDRGSHIKDVIIPFS